MFVSRRKGSPSTVHPCGREFRLGIKSGPVKVNPFLSLSITSANQSVRGYATINMKIDEIRNVVFSSFLEL
jgi:hypothetical protein